MRECEDDREREFEGDRECKTVSAKVIAADGEQEARRLALSRSKSGGACVLQRSAALHCTIQCSAFQCSYSIQSGNL